MVVQDKPTHEPVSNRFLQLAESSKILRAHGSRSLHLNADNPASTILYHDTDLVLVFGAVVREGYSPFRPRCELKQFRDHKTFKHGTEARALLAQYHLLIFAQCHEQPAVEEVQFRRLDQAAQPIARPWRQGPDKEKPFEDRNVFLGGDTGQTECCTKT